MGLHFRVCVEKGGFSLKHSLKDHYNPVRRELSGPGKPLGGAGPN